MNELITNVERRIICGDNDAVTEEELREADAKIRKQGEREAVIEDVKKTGKRLIHLFEHRDSYKYPDYWINVATEDHLDSIRELLALD